MSFLISRCVRKVLSPAFTTFTKTSFSTSNAVLAPRIQKKAPDFYGTAVINGEFKEVKLADYSGKYVVLLFYPLDL